MNMAARSNAAAESAGDFVVAQVNVRAARRANRRCCRATHLLFALAFEALDDGAALSLPEILEPAEDRRTLRRGSFFSSPELQPRLWREWRKRAAALAAD